MKFGKLIIIALSFFVFFLVVPNVTFAVDLCFESPVTYPAGNGPFVVIAADLDGDNYIDLAVANWYSGDLSVLFNNGDGIFTTAVNYSISTYANAVYAADLNNDGYNDLVVTSDRFTSNVAVLINNGDGTFLGAVIYTSSRGPASVTADDMDGDSDIDLVVANEGGENVSILKNNGDGTFSEAVNYSGGNNPYWHCISDFDQDGDLDVAVANIDGHNVSILMNIGDGSFESKINYPANSTPNYVSCADLDNDNDKDLMVTNGKANVVSILMNNGSGVFSSPNSYIVGLDPSSVESVDLNLDGYLDLAVTIASDSISIIMNLGDGTFSLPTCYAIGDNPRSLYVSDIDGDDDFDLIASLFSDGSVAILRNCQLKSAINISLDIKPNSCPNPLKVNAGNPGILMIEENTVFAAKGNPNIEKVQAVFPVAILGTDDFDVSEIDPSTITLQGVVPERWGYEDVSTPISENAEMCECNILGGDGYTDIIMKFDRTAMIASLGTVFDGDIIELTILGELSDGTPFEGVDCVVIRGDSAPIADRFGDGSQLPTVFSLNQNYPNPFNPVTEISYSLPKAGHVKLEVYNTLGQRVVSLIDEQKEAGVHAVNWDASNNASGVYFYRIEAGEFVETKKMMLLK